MQSVPPYLKSFIQKDRTYRTLSYIYNIYKEKYMVTPHFHVLTSFTSPYILKIYVVFTLQTTQFLHSMLRKFATLWQFATYAYRHIGGSRQTLLVP